MGEGANIARRLSNRAANDVSPQVLADEANGIASEHGLWIDVIDEKRAKDWGWGCSSPWARGATTRRG